MTLESTTDDDGSGNMDDVTIEELLNFVEEDGNGDNNAGDGGTRDDNMEDNDVVDDDEDDDPDFLELQQKLAGSNTPPETNIISEDDDDDESAAAGAAAGVQQSPPPTSSDEDDFPQSAMLLKTLQEENAQLRQHLEELQLANDTSDPNAPSTDDLLQQISDLESQLAHSQKDQKDQSELHNPTSAGVSTLLQRIQALETMNRRLEDGNSQLQEQVQEFQQQNQRHLDTIEKLKVSSKDAMTTTTSAKAKEIDPFIPSSKPKLELPQSAAWQYAGQVAQIHELEGTVQNLQERIMGLVEEKLELKLNLDRMEHDLKQYQSNSKRGGGGGGGWFSSAPTAPPSTHLVEDIDTNNVDSEEVTNATSQTDFLKQALAKKKKRESGSRFGFLGNSSSHSGDSSTPKLKQTSSPFDPKPKNDDDDDEDEDDDTIAVELYKKLAEHQARYGADSLGIKSSNNDFDRAVENFESKTIETAPAPPPPPRPSIATGFSSFFASKTAAAVQEEDGQFNSSPMRQDRNATRVPPPMPMDTLPSMLGMGSKKNSREDLDETIEFRSGSSNNNKHKHKHEHDRSILTKEEENRALFPPMAEVNKVMAAHKSATLVKTHKDNPVGLGKSIDQSNLLGHYVTKKKENPFSYLTSMIYGSEDADPDSEDAEGLLRDELNKKRQDDLKAKESTSDGAFDDKDGNKSDNNNDNGKKGTPAATATASAATKTATTAGKKAGEEAPKSNNPTPATFEELTADLKPKTTLSGTL